MEQAQYGDWSLNSSLELKDSFQLQPALPMQLVFVCHHDSSYHTTAPNNNKKLNGGTKLSWVMVIWDPGTKDVSMPFKPPQSYQRPVYDSSSERCWTKRGRRESPAGERANLAVHCGCSVAITESAMWLQHHSVASVLSSDILSGSAFCLYIFVSIETERWGRHR